MPARRATKPVKKPATKKAPAKKVTVKAAPARKAPVKKAPAKKVAPAARPTSTSASRMLAKAQEFEALAEQHGWWTELEQDQKGNTVRVTVKRVDDDGRKETIVATWLGERLMKDGMVYAQVDGPTFVVKNYKNLCRHISDERPLPRRDRKTREMVKREKMERRAHASGMSVEELEALEAKKHERPKPSPYLLAFMMEARGEGRSPRNNGPVAQSNLWQVRRWAEICEEEGYTVTFKPVVFKSLKEIPLTAKPKLDLRDAMGFDFSKIMPSSEKQSAKKPVRRVRRGD